MEVRSFVAVHCQDINILCVFKPDLFPAAVYPLDEDVYKRQVYAYVFNYGNNPSHGAEIPYVFGNENNTLGKQISTAWANFARNGVPSAEGLPQWEPYTRESGATMILDEESRLVHHHDRELMKLLEPDYEY